MKLNDRSFESCKIKAILYPMPIFKIVEERVMATNSENSKED